MVRSDAAADVAVVPHDRRGEFAVVGDHRPAVSGDDAEHLGAESAVAAVGFEAAGPDPTFVAVTDIDVAGESCAFVVRDVRPHRGEVDLGHHALPGPELLVKDEASANPAHPRTPWRVGCVAQNATQRRIASPISPGSGCDADGSISQRLAVGRCVQRSQSLAVAHGSTNSPVSK
jgi:hypothetical protein